MKTKRVGNAGADLDGEFTNVKLGEDSAEQTKQLSVRNHRIPRSTYVKVLTVDQRIDKRQC